MNWFISLCAITNAVESSRLALFRRMENGTSWATANKPAVITSMAMIVSMSVNPLCLPRERRVIACIVFFHSPLVEKGPITVAIRLPQLHGPGGQKDDGPVAGALHGGVAHIGDQ